MCIYDIVDVSEIRRAPVSGEVVYPIIQDWFYRF